ncbi:MAG TPA: hypothetical protein VK623_12325 [Flavobacterium sp.]|nr:hypothetical protein [Flavobacterium sp.]
MIKKLRKYLKVADIDVLIYSMAAADLVALPDIGYEIQKQTLPDSRVQYFIMDHGISIHQSYLFVKLYLLRLIGKKGPAIGDCVTIPEYKGKSIYPFVINHIAHEMLVEKKYPEVFIIVNTDNANSIRGIEKAGFKLYAKIKANRFLLFYYNLEKHYSKAI